MKPALLTLLFLTTVSARAGAQTTPPSGPSADVVSTSLLQDNNGDGLVTIAAFGDSITVGEGDFVSPSTHVDMANPPGREASYPLRIEAFLGISVHNWGLSGEALTQGGESRFISLVTRNRPDIAIIAEGSNDADTPVVPGQIYRGLQKMINAAHAVSTVPVLTTIIPTCCNHSGLDRFIESYNPEIRTLATVNGLALADAHHAFRNTCDAGNCALLSRPEGLHPNIEGYDVMGEAEIAALLQINIFAPDGPTLYAQALGIDPASVKTVPDPAPVAQ